MSALTLGIFLLDQADFYGLKLTCWAHLANESMTPGYTSKPNP